MVTQKYKKHKKIKKPNPLRSGNCVFDNVLANRTNSSLPYKVWQVDGTFFDCCLEGQPKSKHFVLIALDTSCNEVVVAKTFFSKNGYQTCTAKQVIKTLDSAIDKANLDSELLIHTDRGGCFTSRFYNDFIESKPFVTGSMTLGGMPQQNAVIERFHPSFKYQLKDLLLPWPAKVKTTRDFHTIVLKNARIYNEQSGPKKNMALSPLVAKGILLEAKLDAPDPAFTLQACDIKKGLGTFEDHQNIEDVNLHRYTAFVKGSRNFLTMSHEEHARQVHDRKQLEYFESLQRGVSIIVDSQDSNQKVLEENQSDIKEILGYLKPKAKTKPKGLPQRDPIEIATFKAIMSSQKPPKAHERSWGRFLISSAILFYGGLRLNDIAGLTEDDIQQIIDHQKFSIYQKKVNKYRDVFFIEKGIYYIKTTFDDHKAAVFKKDSQLFPAPASGLPNGDKFIRLMNKFLSPFGEERHLVLKSHSFRVNFITSILRKHKVQDAKELIGHEDIRSTMAYNRYKMTSIQKNQILNDVLD